MIMPKITPTLVIRVDLPLPSGGSASKIPWNMSRLWSARILVLVLATFAAFIGRPAPPAHAAAGPFESLSSFGDTVPTGGLVKAPRGVAVESSTGDVFVMDAGDARVVKYNASGTAVLGEFTGGGTPQG